MAKTKSEAKRMTLRQRLRADAEEQLHYLKQGVVDACKKVVGQTSEINALDVMRLCCTEHTKSLEHRVITELANEKEDRLQRFYEEQEAK